MRVNKIIHKPMSPNDDGDRVVFAIVYVNGSYRYCALMYDTFESSKAVQEGQLLDIEKTRFSIRKFN